MKRVILFMAIFGVIASCAYGASQWTKTDPAGSRNASDIDYYVATINNESVDRLLTNYRDGCEVYYVSATTIGVGDGEVVCSNSGGTVRKFRKNTSVTTEDITTEVTGAGTYYVFAVADTDATTFTIEVNSSSTPSATNYKLLGAFYASADDVIANDDGLINYNNYYALRLGDWVIKTVGTVYQASTDGFVVTYGARAIGFTDSSNPPTTQRIENDASGNSGFTMPVKRSDYYKVTNSTTAYWIPNSKEV